MKWNGKIKFNTSYYWFECARLPLPSYYPASLPENHPNSIEEIFRKALSGHAHATENQYCRNCGRKMFTKCISSCGFAIILVFLTCLLVENCGKYFVIRMTVWVSWQMIVRCFFFSYSAKDFAPLRSFPQGWCSAQSGQAGRQAQHKSL